MKYTQLTVIEYIDDYLFPFRAMPVSVRCFIIIQTIIYQ